ncbi:MAG: polynucleotide adenylyltransferase PcnB [Planctomycetes bacterium]|nr:polynucleotide adenylyltransferase PcnB [Planctomycetota bacterium]MCB9910463.1 polynucleotide adenylyltransferase PcnB [Planctomycetota bacterium]MCB9912589.1 polynucleotide adenylyltransferase PcnB [Planctomycetota bacterium]HPF14915.1 polynucleotide adenylyltransferase PcnB [Planctomycetota bacterium]
MKSDSDLPGGRRLLADALDPRSLDPDAKRVVKRLQRHGHEAYFVGGCVRDLLIGREPKDFDVATSASPSTIRRLFRNGRIIGRRFRLVHIYYGDRICETATFRREPQRDSEEEDLLIREDNEYGTAAEDAQRRDFTVNGLFLDPSTLEVLDYVQGLEDLEDRLLRTIGDPERRFAEDPVRIMRAVKFATRLDFEIEDETWDAMCAVAPDLERAAPARVFEEILRLLRSGTSQGAFRMLWACGALDVLLPEHGKYLGKYRPRPREQTRQAGDLFALLEALDHRVSQGYQPGMALCIAALFHPLVEDAADVDPEELPTALDTLRLQVAEESIDPVADLARISRKEAARAARIIAMQPAFQHRPLVTGEEDSVPFSPLLFALSEGFEDALDLYRLRVLARGKGRDMLDAWQARFERAQAASPEEIEAEQRRIRKGKRRRRRRPQRRNRGSRGRE